MDQRELNLGICHKLYHFIIKTLASQAMKTVTLGTSSHYGSSSTKVHIKSQRGFGTNETPCEDKNNPCRNINNVDENEVVAEGSPHVSKKMVSINENVEEVILPAGKKRSKSFQNSNSLEQQDHPKPPLRSILKVGASLDDKSN